MKSIALLFLVTIAMGGCKSKTDAGIVYDSTSSTSAQSQATSPAFTPLPVPTMLPGKHGDTVVTPSGLAFIDTKPGSGVSPKRGETITVNYTGKLTDGTEFDSNVDPQMGHVEPFSTKIGVGQVIPGWDEGMMSMKKGGKRRLIIPSQLGYGPQGMAPKIPGNATLIFDVELLDVKP